MHARKLFFLLPLLGISFAGVLTAQSPPPCAEQWSIPHWLGHELGERHPGNLLSAPCFIQFHHIKTIKVEWVRDIGPGRGEYRITQSFGENGIPTRKMVRRFDPEVEEFKVTRVEIYPQQGERTIGLRVREDGATPTAEDEQNWFRTYDVQGRLIYEGKGDSLATGRTYRYENGRLSATTGPNELALHWRFSQKNGQLVAATVQNPQPPATYEVEIDAGKIVRYSDYVEQENRRNENTRTLYRYDKSGRIKGIELYRKFSGVMELYRHYKFTYSKAGLMKTASIEKRGRGGKLKLADTFFLKYEKY
ncbi:MAG: hypothetical protein AAGN35_07135 [Bacteroidota bacterium]